MLKIYNTLTRKKEIFQSVDERTIKIYVCGPTVYDYCHIGHARAVIAFDVIRRYLEWRFPEKRVVFITNFTDIDDKMIKRANEEGISIFELAERFINQYFQDFDRLNVKRATFYPRATDHIPDMIKFIEGLIKREMAYEIEGNVYFDVEKFRDYGKLSHKKLEDLEPSDEIKEFKKKSPYDFALWKKRKENEPFWDSPWGPGRPGWHIECSVMSMKYLGETFDIHGGGLDLIFPHHENEIAQSEALTGKPFARWFVHNGFIQINKEKMSKSLGNFFTIHEILEKFHPMALRFFLISTHYRSPIDFTEEQIQQAEQRYKRFQLALSFTAQIDEEAPLNEGMSKELKEVINQTKENFRKAMDDDFSTPRALASLNNLIKYLNNLASKTETVYPQLLREARAVLLELAYIIGLVKSPQDQEEDILINKLITFILKFRKEARERKQYEVADTIRRTLNEWGIELLDYPNRTIWTKR
ncbi:MAG: cysteine--tRNA ligase [Candidatus Helarchaeota archaeon]